MKLQKHNQIYDQLIHEISEEICETRANEMLSYKGKMNISSEEIENGFRDLIKASE